MQVYTLLQTDNHTSTPPLSFLQAGRPSCHPTNSVKALKAYEYKSFQIWHLAQSKLHPNQNSSTIKQLLNCDYDASTPVKITVTQRFLSGTQTASNFIAGQLHVKPFQKKLLMVNKNKCSKIIRKMAASPLWTNLSIIPILHSIPKVFLPTGGSAHHLYY